MQEYNSSIIPKLMTPQNHFRLNNVLPPLIIAVAAALPFSIFKIPLLASFCFG